MIERENPSYYAIIPASVRYDNRLKPNEKLMFGEITVLSNKHGYCMARNRYFADLYGVSVGTVSRWIKNLEDCGYIKSVVIRNSSTMEVIERRVYLENIIPSIEKDVEGSNHKDEYPIDEKRKDNSTSFNNTSSNNTSDNKQINKNAKPNVIARLKENGVDEELAHEVWDYRKNIAKSQLTDRALSAIINNCKGNDFNLSEALILMMENGWKGFKVEWVQNQRNIQQRANLTVSKSQAISDHNDMVLAEWKRSKGMM